ncbi:MAG: DUF3578 domain-containing protein [Tannerellaceae bacterium]|nr:DUF3578 domain-containing protein [Tannerellaceae bacterium]
MSTNAIITQKEQIKFSKVQREDILWAIHEIGKKEIPSDSRSFMYDVVYEGKRYPPKLVFSVAYKHATGYEVPHEFFEGGLGTKCFNVLEKHGFDIEPKTIFQTVETFLSQAKAGGLTTKNYAKKYKGLNITVSFGPGIPAQIPWISFLYEGQTTSKGIYPVYLYYKKENILILAYSVSETPTPAVQWHFSEKKETVWEYFARHGYEKPARYSKCYVFKVYDADNLSKAEVNADIDLIIAEYKEQMKQAGLTGKEADKVAGEPFDIKRLILDMGKTGLSYSDDLLARFAISLLTKPFVILSGLSGSGKTRLALSFVKWICEEAGQYKVVPVGGGLDEPGAAAGVSRRVE